MAEIGPTGGAGGPSPAAVPGASESLPRKPAVADAPPVPRAAPDPAQIPLLQGAFRAVPRREVHASPNPKTGNPDFRIVVINGIVLNVPPDGWLA